MNFNDTITKLYEATNELTIYAAQAGSWKDGDSSSCIGIRSFFAGYKNNDPVIDGNSFMVCGDIYCCGRKIYDIYDLDDNFTLNHEYTIILRAVTGFPAVIVNLGEYEIMNKTRKDKNGNITLKVMRRR